jgi:hypothetical protein
MEHGDPWTITDIQGENVAVHHRFVHPPYKFLETGFRDKRLDKVHMKKIESTQSNIITINLGKQHVSENLLFLFPIRHVQECHPHERRKKGGFFGHSIRIHTPRNLLLNVVAPQQRNNHFITIQQSRQWQKRWIQFIKLGMRQVHSPIDGKTGI